LRAGCRRWRWGGGGLIAAGEFWSKNQPDNGDGDLDSGEEDCVYSSTYASAPWNDFLCSATRWWICEKIPTIFTP
uniref:C-type lectin domain-containing protein n=1 Tax=Poecilia reticulata TaxID=8081 RepID=A0A3P9P6Y9_POERE